MLYKGYPTVVCSIPPRQRRGSACQKSTSPEGAGFQESSAFHTTLRKRLTPSTSLALPDRAHKSFPRLCPHTFLLKSFRPGNRSRLVNDDTGSGFRIDNFCRFYLVPEGQDRVKFRTFWSLLLRKMAPPTRLWGVVGFSKSGRDLAQVVFRRMWSPGGLSSTLASSRPKCRRYRTNSNPPKTTT
jgi:hypothetical protein